MTQQKKSSQIKTELFTIQKPVSDFLKKNEVSIITGMAGTSKDHICLYTAIEYLLEKKNGYDKIIITKPIVEVGRSIGFLPGLDEKIDPYKRSFDEIIANILGKDAAATKRIREKIEFIPINFIRGNTFKDSIVILSEAQNTDIHTLISFITRLDKSSKMFLNGDLIQADVPKSGLRDLLKIVERVDGIEHMTLGDEFQTRNKLIVDLNKEYIKFKAQ